MNPILHDFMNLWQVKKQITLDEALPTMVDLLLPKQQVEEHIIPHLSAQSRDILRSRRRTKKVDIPVYDDDIGEGFEGSTELELEKSGGEYFLANWTHVIMRRRAMRGRQIQAGDYLVMNFRSDGKFHISIEKGFWSNVRNLSSMREGQIFFLMKLGRGSNKIFSEKSSRKIPIFFLNSDSSS